MPIQILFFLIACVMVLRTIDRFRRKDMQRTFFLLWLLFWGGLGTVVLFPDITSYFAQLLGVGRGVDLALYGAILIIFFLLFRIYVRLEGFELALTKMVRAIALQQRGREEKFPELEKREEGKDESI